jgi:hypothetical protein
MATAAILKKVYIPKALTHGGYRFCKVSLQKDQPCLRELYKFLSFPWQRQPFWIIQTLDTDRSMAVIVSVKFHLKRFNGLQNRKFEFCFL